MATTTLTEGKKYLIDYKKTRVEFLYQGATAAGHHFFVNDKSCYKIADNQIGMMNVEEVPTTTEQPNI